MIQIGGVYTTFCHREGIHLQKYAIEMGGVSRYFFACIGVRGRLDSPEFEASRAFPEFSPPPVRLGAPLVFRGAPGEGLSEPVMDFPVVLGVLLSNRKYPFQATLSEVPALLETHSPKHTCHAIGEELKGRSYYIPDREPTPKPRRRKR